MAAVSRRWLALDLRALAVYRVVLASLALVELGCAAADVTAFYSDQGILPRSLLDLPLGTRWLAAFLGSGDAWVQLVWMALAGFCALLLLVGKHSRSAGFWLWFLLASLHVRNPLAADRGAMLLELMAFWGLFLPLEARWSLAARDNPLWSRLPDCFRSPATVALLCQFAWVYLFSAVLKNGVAWVVDFQAVLLACRSAQVSTAYSEWLCHFPGLLELATRLTPWCEGVVPLLLLSPLGHDRLRQTAVAGLICFHLHNFVVFRLGYFPLMNALFCLVLLPTSFWDRWLGRRAGGVATGPEPDNLRLSQFTRLWLAVCVAYCLYCNLHTYPKPRKAFLREPMRTFGKVVRLEQYWNLFSPSPPNDLWFRLLARDQHGNEVDLWRADRSVTLDRQSSPMASVPSHLWQMVLLNSVYKEEDNLSRNIVTYWERHYAGRYHDLRYQVVLRDYDQRAQPLPARARALWPKDNVIRLPL